MSGAVVPDEPASVAGYPVVRRLGDGGQAIAYLVKTGEGSEEVGVIKLLKPFASGSKAGSQAEYVGRFRREVAALSVLASTGCPRIIAVSDHSSFDDDSGPHWYLMPYMAGGSMSRVGPGGRLEYCEPFRGDLSRVVTIVGQLAETLAWMHEHEPQMVHRDVHTGNVFFATARGEAYLGDFGLVHIESENSTHLTGEKAEFAPWRWRPPELRAGGRNQSNPKSDVYLLGGVLYEALTEGGFIEETQASDGAFTHELREFNIGRHSTDFRVRHVNELLRHMLARDPDSRHTARQVVEACGDILRLREGAGDLQKAPGGSTADQVASELVAKLKIAERRTVTQALERICTEAAPLGGPCYWGGEYKVSRRVEPNAGDSAPGGMIRRLYSDAPFWAVRVMVRFEPSPNIMLMSYVFVIRTGDQMERVVLVENDGDWWEKKVTYPGDPSTVSVVGAIAADELARLEAEMTRRLQRELDS